MIYALHSSGVIAPLLQHLDARLSLVELLLDLSMLFLQLFQLLFGFLHKGLGPVKVGIQMDPAFVYHVFDLDGVHPLVLQLYDVPFHFPDKVLDPFVSRGGPDEQMVHVHVQLSDYSDTLLEHVPLECLYRLCHDQFVFRGVNAFHIGLGDLVRYLAEKVESASLGAVLYQLVRFTLALGGQFQ